MWVRDGRQWGVTVHCDWVVGAGGRYTLDEEPPGIAGRAGLARWR